MTNSPTAKASQWPSTADRPKVKQGFTRALTRSARDEAFRKDLLQFADQQKVKAAVQKELNQVEGAENMTIPAEIVLIFYIPERGEGGADGKRVMSASAKKFFKAHPNRNYHVFWLPEFKPEDTSEHTYDLHITCCYFPW